jgi:hypothetical protein
MGRKEDIEKIGGPKHHDKSDGVNPHKGRTDHVTYSASVLNLVDSQSSLWCQDDSEWCALYIS